MGLNYILNAPSDTFYCCKICEVPIANMYTMKMSAIECDTRKLCYKFGEIINTIYENNFQIKLNYKFLNSKGVYCKSCNDMLGYHIDHDTTYLFKNKLI